jgi:hypothetical protein
MSLTSTDTLRDAVERRARKAKERGVAADDHARCGLDGEGGGRHGGGGIYDSVDAGTRVTPAPAGFASMKFNNTVNSFYL